MVSSPQSPHETRRLPYVAGLDGLRALAVIAVLLYHASLPVQGGFLGVESFFVISGFLISSLLLVEWQQQRRIDILAFWFRRARRLLPALFFMLAGTLIFASLRLRGERVEVYTDALAALGYVMNWHLILSGQSYFDPLLRPPLLQNLWSLAVEEQFYLLWPLLFVAGMRFLRPSRLLVVILIGAVSSTLLMAWLYRPGADPSRIYYGTDTRLAGLLLGAALAIVWTPGSHSVKSPRRLGLLLDSSGILALGGLLACFVWLSAHQPLLYRGGFAVVAILTAIIIAALTHPCTWVVPHVLSWSPLRGIGLRSYSIYLWHWPVFMVTRPHVDLPLAGLPLLVLRLAIVGVLVELSYRYIELPMRRGALPWHRLWSVRSGLHRMSTRWSHHRPRALGVLCLVTISLLLLSMGSVATERDGTPMTSTVTTLHPSTPQTTATPLQTALSVAVPTPVGTTATTLSGAAPTTLATHPAPTRLPMTPTAAVPQPLDPALVTALQDLLDRTVADGSVPGASLSVSVPGYLPWKGASGLADRSRDVPMEPDTLIHISSITKLFTAVVVLQLVEEGRIDLDTPISAWLPDIVPSSARPTVRQLLSHTSGIFDHLEDSAFFIEAYQNPERTYTPNELVAMVNQYGAAFEPGTEGAWKYSSTNYVILGMLVEHITGRTLAEEMRTRIIQPLDLGHTFFAPQEAVTGTMAQGYIGASDRADVSMTFVFATGNLISTPDDLRRFANGLFSGQLLNEATLAMMTTTVDTGGAYAMPELAYGLGLMQARLNVGPGPDGVQRPNESSMVLGHIGGIAGFRAAVWWVPTSGITIALGLNQADIDPNVLARDTLDLILTWQGH